MKTILPKAYTRWIASVIRNICKEVNGEYETLFLVATFLIATLPITGMMALLTGIAKFIVDAEERKRANGGKLPLDYKACVVTLAFAFFGLLFLLVDMSKGGSVSAAIQSKLEILDGATINPFSATDKIVYPRTVKAAIADEFIRIIHQ
ncbi:MAG: hypothetical protein IJ889_00115 [Eubacterium sp.]|nr:hypothetical protein [Eubacterium sp.]MBR2247322.1 hypothetical protein [Bacilli bacterium]